MVSSSDDVHQRRSCRRRAATARATCTGSDAPGSGGQRRRRALADVLQLFAGLEADGAAGRDAHFLAGAGVAADAALAGLHLKHAKSPQLNTFAALHREPHGSNTASTASSALTLVISARRETSLTMSTLIMRGAASARAR